MMNENDPVSLTEKEEKIAETLVRPRAAVIYETVRLEGEIELQRTFSALWWSGVAAGLSIGFSILALSIMKTYMSGNDIMERLVAPLGYCAGFIIVILARHQLFTENTLTVVLPVMTKTTRSRVLAALKVWGIVFVSNCLGTFIFSVFLLYSDVVSPDVYRTAFEIGHHLIEKNTLTMFGGAVMAGWLIAGMVWVMPSAEGSELWVVIFFTYLIGLIDASHIIAGSVEVFLLVLSGQISFATAIMSFAIPTLVGNVIGGTSLFAFINYAQVRNETAPS